MPPKKQEMQKGQLLLSLRVELERALCNVVKHILSIHLCFSSLDLCSLQSENPLEGFTLHGSPQQLQGRAGQVISNSSIIPNPSQQEEETESFLLLPQVTI